MKKIFCLIAAAAAIGLASCQWLQSKEEKTVNNRPEFVIDVRGEAEYAAGHLENAILIPHTQIAEKIAATVPNRNAAVALYCRSGRRADAAKAVMQKLGYENVENLGSMEDAAKTLNRPIVK